MNLTRASLDREFADLVRAIADIQAQYRRSLEEISA